MGQAKARRAAALAGRPWEAPTEVPLPKDLIACAVRDPLLQDIRPQCWETSGLCIYQAETGRCILKDRFRIDTTILVGDFMHPMADGTHHTYTGEDGKICIETGACHAWLCCREAAEYIDFAAWEAPLRMEANGATWMGPRPDYLWDRPFTLREQGYLDTIHRPASVEVTANIRRRKDSDLLRLYMRSALAMWDAGYRELQAQPKR